MISRKKNNNIKMCFDRVNWFHTMYLVHAFMKLCSWILNFIYQKKVKLIFFIALNFLHAKFNNSSNNNMKIFRSFTHKFYLERQNNCKKWPALINFRITIIHAMHWNVYGGLINWWWKELRFSIFLYQQFSWQ